MEEGLTIVEGIDRVTTASLAVFFIHQGAKVVDRLLSTLDAIVEKCMKMHDDSSNRKEQ